MLQNQAHQIFNSVEQTLVRAAIKFRIQDAKAEVKSWFIRLHQILTKFDQGIYEKKFVDDGELKTISDFQDPWQEAVFLKSLNKYLLKCFVHDLMNRRKRENRSVSFDAAQLDQEQFDKRDTSILTEDAWIKVLTETRSVNDLIFLVEKDIVEAQNQVKVARDQVNVLVLKSILEHYLVASKNGDFPIVSDFAADDHSFFLNDIRDGRNDDVRKIFEVLLSKEPNPIVVNLGKGLLDDTKKTSLNQRLVRYFQSLPERLKKNA